VFSVWSVPRGYKKDKEHRLRQLSFEMAACQDISCKQRKRIERVSGDDSRMIEKIWPERN
jgi:hypothetical protein